MKAEKLTLTDYGKEKDFKVLVNGKEIFSNEYWQNWIDKVLLLLSDKKLYKNLEGNKIESIEQHGMEKSLIPLEATLVLMQTVILVQKLHGKGYCRPKK